MNKKYLFGYIGVLLGVVVLIVFLLHGRTPIVLSPHGLIAMKEKGLMITAVTLMLSLALPVIATAFFIAWKYRATNKKATFSPEWTGNTFLKSLWWGILSVFVIIFFVIVWNGAHELDPYKPIASSVKPLKIHVVALRWKWLFIYPEQHIATINYVVFPVHTPLDLTLTADNAPMNSFWIPSLGGQMYAMAMMETPLHLIANTTGDFPGGAAEINGSGFAGMRFTAHVGSSEDFATWVKNVQRYQTVLDISTYNQLQQPSQDTPVTYYSSVDNNLYNTIIMHYMKPTETMMEMK